ncbi:hypothetical protein STIAU_2207 [Stigmatella aurantiaca DW4/3-1]|uniref:Uncharacterized protein n=1 Tax=Stigmatella aurantiaca (strain DW4/3-1) TaxID=378806 RepID=Q08TZ3_STIAD|nr:hypothetical protein STIAU_2207 [Stigmatella aurantiaca DW4/3-1]
MDSVDTLCRNLGLEDNALGVRVHLDLNRNALPPVLGQRVLDLVQQPLVALIEFHRDEQHRLAGVRDIRTEHPASLEPRPATILHLHKFAVVGHAQSPVG